MKKLEEELKEKIITACKKIARSRKIVAICIYGSRACGYAREGSDYDVLLLLKKYSKGVRYNYRNLDQVQLAVLAVDQSAIESDVETGTLGDFVSGRLLLPNVPILNHQYLRDLEIQTKKRFAQEDLNDLILEYKDLSRGLIIKPDYFVLARMEKRARAYPPLRYSYINTLRSDLRDRNMSAILQAYSVALHRLEEVKIIDFKGENIVIRDAYIDQILSSSIVNKVINLVTLSKRAFSSYLTHSKAGKVSLDVVAKELASKLKRELQISFSKQEIEDSTNYLFIRTRKGLTGLNKQDVIIKVLKRIKKTDSVTFTSLGGALNEVYLVTVNHENLVVKKYTDWFNFKWFILNIVASGTKIFTLSGKSRLSNEYVINQFLAENGISVPEIVSISLQERLLVQRYIAGTSVLDILVELAGSSFLKDEYKESAYKIGQLISNIHQLDVTLGDCKPENFIIQQSGEVSVVDLEQGERYGDKPWDIAEFLYFSGHFANTFTKSYREFVKEFIRGYSTTSSSRILKEAATLNYSRIFFTWTPIPIIRGVSKLLEYS